MQPTALVRDDGGVSPVIGVILLVAVTVLLAGVLAAFAFGFGDTGEQSPTTRFDIDLAEQPPGNASIAVTGGESFAAGRVSITGRHIASSDKGKSWHELDNPSANPGPSSRITAGDEVVITLTDTDWVIKITWESESGGTSARLLERSAPGE